MIEKSLAIHAPLVEAVRAIEASHRRIAVVVAEDGKLLGTLTDGDVRRCLLAGGTLQTTVSAAMNDKPISALEGSSDGYLLDLMRRGNIMAVPLIDHAGRFVSLVHLTDLAPADEVGGKTDFAFAVIMAGGEGMRLRPITENIPKPMVDIGGVPLLERQIQRLAKAGLIRIYLSVNYLSKVIEDHFGNGSGFGLEIRYLREQEKLGTGGALALLPEKPTAPIVVMNGDILTTSDFSSLNAFHRSHGAEITVAAVEYCVNIPFGVVQNSGPYVTGLVEKPSQRFLCNAGIYALAPSVLEHLPKVGAFNMTDLIDHCLAAAKPVAVFPVHEYWSDIGTPADLDKARSLFSEAV
jgi:dTDP-glucose pyrophosphorylase